MECGVITLRIKIATGTCGGYILCIYLQFGLIHRVTSINIRLSAFNDRGQQDFLMRSIELHFQGHGSNFLRIFYTIFIHSFIYSFSGVQIRVLLMGELVQEVRPQ